MYSVTLAGFVASICSHSFRLIAVVRSSHSQKRNTAAQQWLSPAALGDMGNTKKKWNNQRTKEVALCYYNFLVDFWILTYNVASDTHEVVKHMITLENTFSWYGE